MLFTAVFDTAIVVSPGSVLGLIATVPPLLGMAVGLSQVTGTDVGLHIEWSTLAWVVTGCMALAQTATVIVTRRTLQSHPG